jgi:hypothetical protein
MTISELIVNISVSLIAIDLGIYAISNSLLNHQLRINTIFDERRYEETKAEIDTLSKSSSTSSEMLEKIKSRLNEEEKTLKKNKEKLNCLTLNGSVVIPCIGFIISIILLGVIPEVFTLVNFSASNFINNSLIVLSLVSLFFGMFKLYCTLNAIEFSISHLPLPNFDVHFDNEDKSIDLPVNKNMKLIIDFQNNGYDIAELIDFSAFFPPEFTINKNEEYYSIDYQPSFATYSGYNRINVGIEYLHIDSGIQVEIDLLTPSIIGTYSIPISIDEKKITQVSHKLIINIV